MALKIKPADAESVKAMQTKLLRDAQLERQQTLTNKEAQKLAKQLSSLSPQYQQNCKDLLLLLDVLDAETREEAAAALRLLESIRLSVNAQDMRVRAEALIEKLELRCEILEE